MLSIKVYCWQTVSGINLPVVRLEIVNVCILEGPVANIHRNVQDVAFSMGCNIDLQVEHSKVMWKALLDPLVNVVQNIVVGT